MRETLFFATSQDMASVLDKIRSAFPKMVLCPIARGNWDFYPVGIDLGIIEEHDFASWALDNDVMPFCVGLVLHACDPACEWMHILMEASRLKKEAKKLEG